MLDEPHAAEQPRTAYVAGVIDKLERRLSRAVRGGGYRFPVESSDGFQAALTALAG